MGFVHQGMGIPQVYKVFQMKQFDEETYLRLLMELEKPWEIVGYLDLYDDVKGRHKTPGTVLYKGFPVIPVYRNLDDEKLNHIGNDFHFVFLEEDGKKELVFVAPGTYAFHRQWFGIGITYIYRAFNKKGGLISFSKGSDFHNPHIDYYLSLRIPHLFARFKRFIRFLR